MEVGDEVAAMAPARPVLAIRRLFPWRQCLCARRAAQHLTDPDMWRRRPERFGDRERRQVGRDELGLRGGIQIQHRDVGEPAGADRRAPAQLQGPHRTVLGQLIDDVNASGIMLVIECLGEDRP